MNAVAEKEELLHELLKRNRIRTEDFLQETYRCLIVSLFEVLTEEMKEKSCKDEIKKRLRNSINPVLTVQNIVFEQTGCRISLEEAEQIYKYLLAYFRKKPARAVYELRVREEILLAQCGKCNICGIGITESSAELDHVIPWALVGDELGVENLQMLCSSCNKHKSKSISYNLKMFLIHKSE